MADPGLRIKRPLRQRCYEWCPVQAQRRNAPLIQFLTLGLYILFACLYRIFPTYLFFFTVSLSPPLLVFTFENRHALVFRVCRMRASVVLSLVFFNFKPGDWLGETTPK